MTEQWCKVSLFCHFISPYLILSLVLSTTPDRMSLSGSLLTWWRDIEPRVPAMLHTTHTFNLTESDKTPVTRGLGSGLPPTPNPSFRLSLHLPCCEVNKFLDIVAVPLPYELGR